MDKNHILKACKSKGMVPVCDHHAYRDGVCYDSGVNLHFSHPSHDKNAKLNFPVAKAKGVFWYTGRHHTGSLLNTGSTHRWRNGNDKNGLTMCMKKGGVTVWKGHKFVKVRVSGPMDKNHILKACKSKGMVPVCDHHAYRDGVCYDSGVNLHFSHPSHDRHAKLNFPVAKAKGVFWYTGRHHTGSLLNTGSTHRWRNGNDKNGFTMCMKKGGVTVWKGHKFVKVRVSGPMDKNHILKACKSKG